VLRAPLGTGIYPRRKTHNRAVRSPHTTGAGAGTSAQAQGQGQGQGHIPGSGVDSRGPDRDSEYTNDVSMKMRLAGANPFTVATSCGVLADNGLNDHLGELLELVHMSNIEEVVNHLGVQQFAGRVRATDQLKRLYKMWLAAHHPELSETKNCSTDASFGSGMHCDANTCA
jgi:hypothetical protein